MNNYNAFKRVYLKYPAFAELHIVVKLIMSAAVIFAVIVLSSCGESENTPADISGSASDISDTAVFAGNEYSDDAGSETLKYDRKVIDVPFISQMPDFPTGCEGVSAVMVLRTAGVYTTPELFFAKYLTISDFPFDPDKSYCGDPGDDSGMGCYAPALAQGMNKALSSTSYEASVTNGLSMDKLCSIYIDNDIPVIIWASVDMSQLHIADTWEYNGKVIEWKSPEHCLVLVGYEKEYYIFNDPLTHKCKYYPRNSVISSYNMMGRQAVVVNN